MCNCTAKWHVLSTVSVSPVAAYVIWSSVLRESLFIVGERSCTQQPICICIQKRIKDCQNFRTWHACVGVSQVQDRRHSICNPFFNHWLTTKALAVWFRSQGVMVRKVTPLTRSQIREVNVVEPGYFRELQVWHSTCSTYCTCCRQVCVEARYP